ncbi:hypothetical protein [Paenibacillus phytohabitans]|uniref:hypothetical protein n=1 Tax=Paenibacillus phytohabitans TaxID=2654978 RepID=UPI001490D1CF|nr:hypothetical protein [Paenibacillus phytohabitans]
MIASKGDIIIFANSTDTGRSEGKVVSEGKDGVYVKLIPGGFKMFVSNRDILRVGGN